MPELIIESLANLGAAGVVGLLWVWERATSRRREQQLDETHRVIHDKDQQIATLVQLVRRNTIAMARIERTHDQLRRLLERMFESQRQNKTGHAAPPHQHTN